MHHYPFHPGDYMLDTAHLTLEEDATYRRALDLYYVSEGPLADDKRTLSKRLRVAEQTLAAVLSEFFVLQDDGWHHARCDAEIQRYKDKSEKAKLAGSKGGMAKKESALANAKRPLSKRLANQNQEPEPRTNKEKALPFVSAEFSNAWKRWESHRKEIRKPLTPTTTEQQLKQMAAMTESAAIAMIENSIRGGYQGLFEAKPAFQPRAIGNRQPGNHSKSCL